MNPLYSCVNCIITKFLGGQGDVLIDSIPVSDAKHTHERPSLRLAEPMRALAPNRPWHPTVIPRGRV
jgi:hypothetical protein